MRGEVVIREFLGNIIRYEVLVGKQHLIIDEVYEHGKSPAEIGASVGLQLDSDSIMIM